MVKTGQVNKNAAKAVRTFGRNQDKFRYFVVFLVLFILPVIFLLDSSFMSLEEVM